MKFHYIYKKKQLQAVHCYGPKFFSGCFEGIMISKLINGLL